MKVLYDHQIFQNQTVGGISRYFREIMERAALSNAVEVKLSLRFSRNTYLRNSIFQGVAAENPDEFENFLSGREFRGKWCLYSWRNKLREPIDSNVENKKLSINMLRKQDFDVFHPTYYDDYFLPFIGDKPFVLTVYDMIHEIFPEYFDLMDGTSRRKKILAEKATRIIAISESTKRDLINFFSIPSEKIQVVYLANSLTLSDQKEVFHTLPQRYMLFVGARTIYKNFYFFVNSIAPLLRMDSSLHLVCAGAAFGKGEIAFFQRQGIADQLHSRSASDGELGELYRHALVFVFPSLYEGFGLPVLEAFNCGCPAVLSDAGSLREVGRDAALYFEPKNPLALRNALAALIADEGMRVKMAAMGKERAKSFSWDKATSETSSLYRNMVSKAL